ncbi:MAG TPA: hypothetical protein VFO23_15165 [Steroidobacteraceae bacterium]|nr:hypothetical protein [Steroidobacteraceae bacterium]
MKTKTIWSACTLLALVAGTAAAADSPWNGTWKLDAAKSHLTGQTFTYSKGPGEMLHYEDGSTASFDFGLDGKEYKSWGNRTVSFTAAGHNTWDTQSKAGGRVLDTGHFVLSEDGKTLTMTFDGKKPDGSAYHEEDVFTRVSGTEGLIGTWRSTKVKGPSGPQSFVISAPADGMLRYDIPDMKAYAEGNADGTDHPITGPDVPPGMTIGFKMLSPKKVKYTIKLNGKVDSVGVQTIAADGASFSDVSWNPGKANEKTTVVYVKQ